MSVTQTGTILVLTETGRGELPAVFATVRRGSAMTAGHATTRETAAPWGIHLDGLVEQTARLTGLPAVPPTGTTPVEWIPPAAPIHRPEYTSRRRSELTFGEPAGLLLGREWWRTEVDVGKRRPRAVGVARRRMKTGGDVSLDHVIASGHDVRELDRRAPSLQPHHELAGLGGHAPARGDGAPRRGYEPPSTAGELTLAVRAAHRRHITSIRPFVAGRSG